MNVLYYYYYLFYQKVIKDNEPHLLATLVLSFSESLLLNGIAKITLAAAMCGNYGKWPALGVLLALIGINYLIYHKNGQSQEDCERETQVLRKSSALHGPYNVVFLITTSFLFWGSDFIKHLLTQCQ